METASIIDGLLDELVEKLIAKQGDMSDQAFADTMGISRQLWNNVRRKISKPDTRKFIPAVMKTFPEFIPLCLTILTTKEE